MQEQNPTEIALLIHHCVLGDDDAKAKFVTRYADLIRATVRRKLSILPDRDILEGDYEDICQEIFLRLFAHDCKALQRIEKPASITAWLTTVSQNQVITFLRRRNVRARTVASAAREEKAIYSPPIEASADQMRLRDHINSLSPDERLIIQLYFEDNLRYSDIAQIMNLNINTVSSKLRRAKKKLRDLLTESSND